MWRSDCALRYHIRSTFTAIGEMRADTNLSITSDFHPHQRMFEPGDGLAPPEHNRVVNERHPVLHADHLFGEMLGLFAVQRDFVAPVSKRFWCCRRYGHLSEQAAPPLRVHRL